MPKVRNPVSSKVSKNGVKEEKLTERKRLGQEISRLRDLAGPVDIDIAKEIRAMREGEAPVTKTKRTTSVKRKNVGQAGQTSSAIARRQEAMKRLDEIRREIGPVNIDVVKEIRSLREGSSD